MHIDLKTATKSYPRLPELFLCSELSLIVSTSSFIIHSTLERCGPVHSRAGCRLHLPPPFIMASHRDAVFKDQPYTDPNPLPSSIPPIDELGVTSAPLKSASFFIGSFCKEVNGEPSIALLLRSQALTIIETRGFHAVQVGEPRSRALFAGGTEGDTMRF